MIGPGSLCFDHFTNEAWICIAYASVMDIAVAQKHEQGCCYVEISFRPLFNWGSFPWMHATLGVDRALIKVAMSELTNEQIINDVAFFWFLDPTSMSPLIICVPFGQTADAYPGRMEEM